jgi:hypothetical protein
MNNSYDIERSYCYFAPQQICIDCQAIKLGVFDAAMKSAIYKVGQQWYLVVA